MPVSELLAALPQAGRSPHAPDAASVGPVGARKPSAADATAGPQSSFQRFLRELRRATDDRSEAPRESARTIDPPSAQRDVRTARAEDPQTPQATDSVRSGRADSARPDPTDAPRGIAAGDGSGTSNEDVESRSAADDRTGDALGSDGGDVSRVEDEAGLASSTAASEEAPPSDEAAEPHDADGSELPPGLRALFAQLAEALQSGADGDEVPSLPNDGSESAAGQAPPGLVALWNRWTATGSLAASETDGCGASEECGPDGLPAGLDDLAGTGDGRGAPTILDALAATEPGGESAEGEGHDTKNGADDASGAGVAATDVLAIVPPLANAAPGAIAPAETVVETDARAKSKSELRTDRTGSAGHANDDAGESTASHAALGALGPSPADASIAGPASPTDDVPVAEAVPSDVRAADIDGTTSRGSTPAAAGPAPGTGQANGTRGVDGELTVPPHVDPQRFADRLARFVGEAHVGDRTLRVRLEPPELGALRIEVSLRDGALSARLDVQTEAARRTLAEHLPLLHEALARQGTALERVDVQRENGDGQGFANDRNSAGRGGTGGFGGFDGSDGRSGGNESSRAPFAAASSEPEPASAGPARTSRPGRDLSGLDIRV